MQNPILIKNTTFTITNINYFTVGFFKNIDYGYSLDLINGAANFRFYDFTYLPNLKIIQEYYIWTGGDYSLKNLYIDQNEKFIQLSLYQIRLLITLYPKDYW